jgi:Transposase DDE domain group 1
LRVQATNSPSCFEVTTDGTGVVGHAGAALLRELADQVGLTRALGWGQQGTRRRHPDAVVLRDLAVLLADGGDCLSDLAALRDQPELFGPVASTPTAWRVIERLALDPDGLARLRAARAHARGRAWAAGGDPGVELLIIDADATLVTAHSDAKQGAAGTYKGSFGLHPLLAYLDRGQAPGEPLAGLLRPGNAPAGASDDLIELVDLALAQLPATSHQPVLVRSDSAGASTRLAWHLRDQGVGFSLGMPIDAHVREAILAQPEQAWTPAVDADGQVRHGAEVVELTGWIDLHSWPAGTRALCRREDAHPGAQLRFTDHDGHRFQVFLTDQPDGDLAGLELRHRQRARVEDRIRAAKATGWPISRSTAGAATPSGWSWSWPPKTCAAGPRRCCWTAPWRSPSPRRCATGCCTWPPGWSATPAARSCGCNEAGRGRSSWRRRSPGCEPCRCAAEPPPAPPGHGGMPACPPAAIASRGQHSRTSTTPVSARAVPGTPPTPPDNCPRDHHHAHMKNRG